jgi:hypothetical protein
MLSRTNFTAVAIALVLFGIVASQCPTSASAQNILLYDYKKIKAPREIMNAEVKRGVAQVGNYGSEDALGQKFSLPPLPGDQSFTDSAKDAAKFMSETNQMPDFGATERKNVSIVLPPLKGLSQILNSSVTKDFLKDLTAAETTVLMQTYMMVENGAATGFMGGMNIGSNLMSNMLQAQDFQLKLMEATDDTGKMKEAYVNRIASIMQEGNNKDVWPAALYIASGDDGKGKVSKDAQPMKDLSQAKDGVGAFNLKGLAAEGTTKDSPEKRMLTDMLFMKGSGTGGEKTYFNDPSQLNNLREDFISMVGDVEIVLKSEKSKLARDVQINFIAPTSSASTDRRRGVAKVNWEEVQVVWQNLNLLLYDYCKWIDSDENKGKKFAKGVTSTTTDKIGQYNQEGVGTSWELSSAPDITMTMNVLDEIMALMGDKITDPDKRNCDALKLEEKDIPDMANANSGDVNLDDCGSKQGCEKNRAVLHLSYMIARSRTLHTYRSLYNLSRRFVTEPIAGELLDKLFDRAFSGMDLNAELQSNRERYYDFVSHMGKLEQGKAGSGSIVRPGSPGQAGKTT